MNKATLALKVVFIPLLFLGLIFVARAVATTPEMKKLVPGYGQGHPDKVIAQVYQVEPTVKLIQLYRDGDLKKLRVENSGKPIEVKLHESTYILGKGDFVEVDPPKVKMLLLQLSPYTRDMILTPAWTVELSRDYLVELGPQKNNSVSN